MNPSWSSSSENHVGIGDCNNSQSKSSSKSVAESKIQDYKDYTSHRKSDTYSPYSSRTFPSLRQNSTVSDGSVFGYSARSKKLHQTPLEPSSQTVSSASNWSNETRDESEKVVYVEKYTHSILPPQIKSNLEISKSKHSGHFHSQFHGSTVIRLGKIATNSIR